MYKPGRLLLILILFPLFSGVIDTSAESTTTDEAIKQSIAREAGNSPILSSTKVKVAVEDGNVVLYGTVSKYLQKMTYEAIAWKTEDVVEVDNEIRVIPLIAQTDAAIERKIKEILQSHRQFQGANTNISVNAGAVSVLTVLNHPAEILFLKKKIAEIDGVISVDISAQFIPVVRFDQRPIDGSKNIPPG